MTKLNDEAQTQPLSREEIAAWAKEHMGIELEP
jgi:hypothetical protein